MSHEQLNSVLETVSDGLWEVCPLTSCLQAGGTAVRTLAAFPQWTSSDGSPAQTCSERHRATFQSIRTDNKTRPLTQAVYLVEGSQVVPGLDEEGLVDPGVVHVVSRRSHQAQEDVQRAQLLRQLQNTR